MSNNSKNHHFVPEFYQKGFCNDAGELFAYKKTYGSLKSWSPSQILYEKHLHTINIKNERTLMIEEYYSQVEGEFSKYIAILNVNVEDNELMASLIQDGDFMRIAKLMVAIQFWRTPCKKQLAVEYSYKLLGLYDKADDEIKKMLGYDRKFIKFMSKRANKNNCIKVIQFLILPLLSFDFSKELMNIKLLKTSKRKVLFSSDRPVICDDLEKLFSFRSFIFPFSRNLLLLGSENDVKQVSIDKINLLIEKRAMEIVICGSKEQLKELKSNKARYTAQHASA